MKAKLFLVNLIFSILLNYSFNSVIYSENSVRSFIYPPAANSTGPNLRIYPGINLQVQTSIYTHPNNPLVMVGSAITDVYPGGYTSGAYITTNGGLNWQGTNSISNQLNSIIATIGDVSIIIDKTGNYIMTYSAFPPLGGDLKVGISYSTNNGIYWSSTGFVPGVDDADKVLSAADNSSSSAHYGNIYLVYSEFRKAGIYFSTSTDGGRSWDSVKRITPAYNDPRVGSSICVGSLGDIFVSWPFYDTLSHNSFVGIAKSSDGGTSWSSKDTAILVNTVRLGHRLFLNGTRLNGIPTINIDKSSSTRNGTIYVVSTEKSAFNSPALDSFDIVVHSSTNKGITWNTAHKVNQDVSVTNKYQFFAAIDVDKYGGLNVVYYDSRNTSTNDSFEVYLSRSVDGGTSFQDFLVSDHKFKLQAINPTLFGISGYIGSYIGITSGNNTITPLWFDNSTGIYQAWSANIKFGALIKVIPQGLYDITTGLLTARDTVTFYLRSTTSPFLRIDSAKNIIDSITFVGSIVFPHAASGLYYIEVRNRNTLETWSKNPVSFSVSSVLNYDFTTSSAQAYGNNMILIGNKWCIYSGDVNQDGTFDATDMINISNDISNWITGYVPTDINDNGLVDKTDMVMAYNNTQNFVGAIIP